jgi:hypothetical protein
MADSAVTLIFPQFGMLYQTLGPLAEALLRMIVGLALVPRGAPSCCPLPSLFQIELFPTEPLQEIYRHKLAPRSNKRETIAYRETRRARGRRA